MVDNIITSAQNGRISWLILLTAFTNSREQHIFKVFLLNSIKLEKWLALCWLAYWYETQKTSRARIPDNRRISIVSPGLVVLPLCSPWPVRLDAGSSGCCLRGCKYSMWTGFSEKVRAKYISAKTRERNQHRQESLRSQGKKRLNLEKNSTPIAVRSNMCYNNNKSYTG